MSHSELERLTNDLRDNELLREEAKKVGSDANALIDFAAKKSYDITMDDVSGALEGSELSEEALENVVGGAFGAFIIGSGGLITLDEGEYFIGGTKYGVVNT